MRISTACLAFLAVMGCSRAGGEAAPVPAEPAKAASPAPETPKAPDPAKPADPAKPPEHGHLNGQRPFKQFRKECLRKPAVFLDLFPSVSLKG